MSLPRLLFVVVLLSIGALIGLRLDAQGDKNAPKGVPQWIWLGPKAQDNQTVYFRKTIPLSQRVISAKLFATCDNGMTVYLDGQEILAGDSWETPVFRDVSDQLATKGMLSGIKPHTIAVEGRNSEGIAGLVLYLVLETPQGSLTFGTNASWKASAKADKGWKLPGYDDSAWAQAAVVGNLGDGPWAKINQATLTRVAQFKNPSATPSELIKVKKDFKVELLYTVPRQTQGSWVNMCVDPKGRIIVSDQYGKLYRIVPPALDGKAEDTKVEQLPVDIGEAHGLCWAFDSLYVVVNEGRNVKPRGLWRVTSSNKDDVLDKKELLRELDGSGEHGPHAVIPHPDGKSLIVACGNHTKLPKLSGSVVSKVYGEDFLVPRQWDASGHAVNIFAPGGYFCRVDPEGKNWELYSVGYRNQFDAAFNRDGELFTFDSDMEWDINLPWYKATRVCHVVPGSEFGWRSGTSNFPWYYADALPPTVDIGPGSPCGTCFGYGAKFPIAYQNAFFICDWSYGKLYAVHFKANGASYTGEAEEFMNGSPLPLTDIAVNPKDGAMYFTIGGRNTLSGLYRITYVGKESTKLIDPTEEQPASAASAARAVRRKLEAFYGKKDPQAVATAWPHLSSDDWFVRFAARTALEFQDPETWQDKALAEKNPTALTHALIGLVRTGDKALQPKILEAIHAIDWSKLREQQQLDLLRLYQLVFIRQGAPGPDWKEKVGKRLEGFYPAPSRDVNSELAKLISYLETPDGVGKTLALIAQAPTQEEQIDYVFALRTVKSGWTIKQREEYFNWFHKAAGYRGGNSFHGFVRNIRSDAIKSLSDETRQELRAVLGKDYQPLSPKVAFKDRPFVKKWTVDELAPAVEKNLVARNFNQGRNLFAETKCFACHRFQNEGGGTGPDLTGVSGRFNPRDLLESLIEPSKTISDQYSGVVITTHDSRIITGRIVNLQGDGIMVNVDMLDPNNITTVNRSNIDTIGPAKTSMMPDGLLDTLTQEEVLDLVAYLYSRGDRNNKMFRKP